jgi:hypothetical protein
MSHVRNASLDSKGEAPLSPASPTSNSQKARNGTGADSDSGHAHGGHGRSDDVILVEAREDLGADKAEASAKVWGRYSRWFLYISLGLAAYVYSLDQTTTYFYISFATSSFSHHSLLSSIEVAAQVIRECSAYPLFIHKLM